MGGLTFFPWFFGGLFIFLKNLKNTFKKCVSAWKKLALYKYLG